MTNGGRYAIVASIARCKPLCDEREAVDTLQRWIEKAAQQFEPQSMYLRMVIYEARRLKAFMRPETAITACNDFLEIDSQYP